MKFFFSTLLIAFSLAAGAQKTITLEEAKDHVGDSVTLTGKVFGIRYFAEGKGAPTLINMGAAFPNQLLTVVIYGDDRRKMSADPEKAFADQQLTVSGKVELYKGRPQIVVREEAQVKLTEQKQ